MEEMALIRTVNEHFQPFYPYIAEQAMAACGQEEVDVLEIGPYCPGISLALAERWPGLRIVVGDDRPETNAYFGEKIATAGLEGRVEVRHVDKFALGFPEGSFDLVVFRGGLFFWGDMAGILREAYRVLRPGGVALVGGGFGARAPDELIENHLERSRELNRLLNKSRLTSRQVWDALCEAGVADHATLDHRHGLWAVLRRPDSLERLRADVAGCRLCQDASYLKRANPIVPVLTGGRLMIIGQAPGRLSDERGYHFAGPGGHVLAGWLERAGFPPGYFRHEAYLTSLTRCYPGPAPGGHGDRRPTAEERRLCRPYLDRELRLLDPAVVLLAGQMAIEAFLPDQPLARLVGTQQRIDGRLFLPLPHPSGVSRWLNDPAHCALLERAIALLARARETLGL